MYNKKNVTSFVILCVFISQIVFTNIFSLSANASETVSESVYSNQTFVESEMIGDVNGDEQINSVDFALMRMVLLGARNSFPISNGEWASDTDGNRIFNSIDFAIMRKFLLGIITIFPAEANEKQNPFNYALFSGDTKNDLILCGNNIEIDGDIHSNSSINIHTDVNSYIHGECSAVNDVTVSGLEAYKSIDGDRNVIIPMPDLSGKFDVDAKTSKSYFSNELDSNGKRWIDYINEGSEGCIRTDLGENLKCTYIEDAPGTWSVVGDNLELKEDFPLYFDGNVIFSLDSISGSGFIIASGSITLNNGVTPTDLGLKYNVDGTVDLENSAEIGFYSVDGDIQFNFGTDVKFKGLIYVPGEIKKDGKPGGNIQVNSRYFELYGSMVASKLTIGGNTKVHYAKTEVHKIINDGGSTD